MYREVKASDRLPSSNKGLIVEHKTQGLMVCWWVADPGVWKDAEETQYGPNEMNIWLEPVEITEEEIEKMLQAMSDELAEKGFTSYAEARKYAHEIRMKYARKLINKLKE